MKKTILVFSLLSFALLVLFQISKYSIISGDTRIEIVLSVIAVVFFIVGYIIHKNKRSESKMPSLEIDKDKIKELEITAREYEVLKAIQNGLSNKEIADQLFLSESTIKTHVSSLLVKLNAKRRTQAIQIAKRINII